MKLLIIPIFFLSLTLSAEVKKIIDVPISVVVIHGEDPELKSSRLIIYGNTAYKTLDDFLIFLSKQINHPTYPSRYVIYGDSDPKSPQFSAEEIKKIKNLCKKRNLPFFYFLPG